MTRIDYEVPASGALISLRVYDVAGRLVRTLMAGHQPGGPATVAWDGRDDRGSAVSSGTYLCRLAGEGTVQTRRMVLLQ